MSRKKHITLASALLVILTLLSFVLWAALPYQATAAALDALDPSPQVAVSQADWLIFEPAAPPSVGLIIYPGARVDPRAYAPIAHAVADAGYLAVIVPMPLNMAFFDSNAADAVRAAYPAITTWSLAGHSLGGAMAGRYVANNPDIAALALWAAYPAADLASSDAAVAVIYGSRDGLMAPEELEAKRATLPADTTWVEIAGGNHAQFGLYGAQDGDLPATISPAEQQAQVIAATLDLLASASSTAGAP